jgi:phage minor structural protein
MIPILYAPSEKNFTNSGLGRLTETTSCKVTEERNGQFELELIYPVTGRHFTSLALGCILYAVPADGKGKQAFRIYKISKPMSGLVTVNARHISYQLSAIPTKADPDAATTAADALAKLKQNAVEPCPFTFWTDVTTSATYQTKAPASIRSCLGGTEGSVLDVFGGEYEWDNWTVKLHKSRGTDTGITLRYEKNITDIRQEDSIENTATGVFPYWIKESEGGTETASLKSPVYAENADSFPYHMTMVLDVSQEFTEKPTDEQLTARALSYIKANQLGVPDVSITVSFLALWQTENYRDIAPLERVNLCDTVRVEFPALGVSASAKVVKTVYDVLLDRYDSIELGSARTNLSDTISGAAKNAEETRKRTDSFLQKAVSYATKLIEGGLGGHVVMHTNADGKPNEILIMDTESTATAVHVIRMNVNGIGFSKNGYNGPYTTAWTIDGKFNADFITAGTINADLIKSGTLNADLIRAGTLKVGGVSDTVGSIIVYGNNTSNTLMKIDDTGLFFNASWWRGLSTPLMIDMRPNIFDGMAIKKNVNGTGAALGFSPSQILLKNNADSLIEGYSLQYPSCEITYNKFMMWNGLMDQFVTMDGGDRTFRIDGSFSVSGTKSRVAATSDYGDRKLYCYEMPCAMFGDTGEGTINEDGLCYVPLDPVFTKTVSAEQYQVFLQKYGDGDCFVKERHPSYFVVSGTAGLSFGWEMKARQKGFDQLRLERDMGTVSTGNKIQYADEADTYLQNLQEGRQNQ